MNIKQLVVITSLFFTTLVSNAEILTFNNQNGLFGHHILYPGLDLSGNTEIKLQIEKTRIENTPELKATIKKLEFKFENANNLVVYNFQKLAGTYDTYRSIITSPWVFKKVMIEIRANQFVHNEIIDFNIYVVEDHSDINTIASAVGAQLLSGSSTLLDVSPNKVVDILRTTYLNKALTLKLYEKVLVDKARIEAVWLGHGTKTLQLNIPTHSNLKPIALLSEIMGNDQEIRIRLNDGISDSESQSESLHDLLEQEFGPIPLP